MLTHYTHRPTFALIDLDALEHNYNAIKDRLGPDVRILSVMKADAYGHGSVALAANLERLGVAAFGVAFCEEGVRLREGGITRPILVMGGIYWGEAMKAHYYNLTPVIISRENALATIAQARDAGISFGVHVKIDTGMNRIGVQPEEAVEVSRLIRESGVLQIDGYLTHLSGVMPSLDDNYWKQATAFRDAVQSLEDEDLDAPWKHLAASAASMAAPRPPFNMVRIGIAMLGAFPNPNFRGMLDLQPVLTLRTQIAHLKTIPVGARVSYGGLWEAQRPSVIATIPMGYADGLNRRQSNKGHALVRGVRVPITGAVCMDMAMLDVTDVPGVSLGDEVVLIGAQGNERITVEEVADVVGTSAYEIFTNINYRVARIYRKAQPTT
ncbi:MAG: alanine racemase [Deltaproteobacteria bacterium]|nr:alanine racemase [Deltaproteobacteria bacterium]